MDELAGLEGYRDQMIKERNGHKLLSKPEFDILKSVSMNMFGKGKDEFALKFERFIHDNYVDFTTDQIVARVFSEGIEKPEDIAKKLGLYGNSEIINGGIHKNGLLCSRYLKHAGLL